MADSNEWYGPRAISDGTLRFLALVTMQMDYEGGRVLCMEEPENGIHPYGVAAMVRLLRDFSVDPELELAEDNPPRQVVLNTHSADILRQLSSAEVLFVERVNNKSGAAALVTPVEGGWREHDDPVTRERLIKLMGGAPHDEECWPQLPLPFPAT
jgi:predicted ATPase